MAALLPDGEGGGASETAELPPHALPLQGLVGLPYGELGEVNTTPAYYFCL